MQISTTANCNANALHRAAGFTLVEILVVVVMVAMLGPWLARGAQRRAVVPATARLPLCAMPCLEEPSPARGCAAVNTRTGH